MKAFVSKCGRVRMYCADNSSFHFLQKEADAIITDPPYGMKWKANQRFTGGTTRRGKGTRHKSIQGDNKPFDPAPWLAMKLPTVIFGANHCWDRLPSGTALVWQKKTEKGLGKFLSDGELAFLNRGHGVYIFPHLFCGSTRAIEAGRAASEGSLHPNQKPIALMEWVIQKAKVPEGGTVWDPYMGSGTTLIAALRSGRKAIGNEIDPAHFETAVKRVKAELRKGGPA